MDIRWESGKVTASLLSKEDKTVNVRIGKGENTAVSLMAGQKETVEDVLL